MWLCVGHGGVTLGYIAVALSSKDGSHVVVAAANAFTPGAFEDLLVKTARRAYCRS